MSPEELARCNPPLFESTPTAPDPIWYQVHETTKDDYASRVQGDWNVEKPKRRLTEQAGNDRTAFEAYYGKGNCSCFKNAPCGSCTHPGNPVNQEEDDECWEQVMPKKKPKPSFTTCEVCDIRIPEIPNLDHQLCGECRERVEGVTRKVLGVHGQSGVPLLCIDGREHTWIETGNKRVGKSAKLEKQFLCIRSARVSASRTPDGVLGLRSCNAVEWR